jgi:CysZ protein
MDYIFEILRRAAADLQLPRVLSVMLLPMFGALVIWGGLLWWFGAAWIAGLESLVFATPLPAWVGASLSAWLQGFATVMLLGVLLLPAIYITALLITSLAFMPMLTGIVARQHYPRLERKHGGSFAGGVVNGLYAVTLYLLLWLVALPFWLLGPLGAAVSVLLGAWLNKRLFIYDALSEHASAAELERLQRDGGWRLFLLSAILGMLHFVPLINFFAPVYMALAFTHYGLDQLDQLRTGVRS